MARRQRWSVGYLDSLGVNNGSDVYYLEKDSDGYVSRCKCATANIPSAVVNTYAIGCLLVDTTTGKLYKNSSLSSCSFDAVGDITSAELADSIDLGSSGTAGDLDIFPAGAAKGKLTISAVNNAGDTATTIKNAEQAAARIYTIPDAGTDADFVMNAGAQTIAGVKSFTSPIVSDTNTTITAFAGGGQASATALTGEFNNVTTVASAYDSVKLLAAVLGQTQTVKNSGASILSVFPNTDDSINALAANLSVDIPVGGEMTFRAISATVWETNEVLVSQAPSTQKGYLVVKAADNAANHAVTITNASHGQATVHTHPDGGAATDYVVHSTAALTLLEADVLDGATAGVPVASKALIAPASLGNGAVAGTGATVSEQGNGVMHKTVITFTNVDVPLADAAGVVAYGGLKVYDMPEGAILMLGAVADVDLTKSSAGVNADWDGDMGVGTITASNDGTLAATEQNIIPTTATPQAVAGVTTANGKSTATENAVLDGTTTPVDVYFNLLVDDADHDVTGTPCNLILNGTLTLHWINLGDY